jgi:hypothetical protein
MRRDLARESLEDSLVAQHAEHRFRDECAVVLAERALLAKIMAEHAVRGMLELEHKAERVDSALE